jgi:hypothetical protein
MVCKQPSLLKVKSYIFAPQNNNAMNKDFKNIAEAFEWFMNNVYPGLSTEHKLKLKDVKYDYYHPSNRNVSEKRMRRVLNEHGKVEDIVRYHVRGRK